MTSPHEDKIRGVPCFESYRRDPDPSLDPSKVIKYVVLLYSQDSVLNSKPMPPLIERRERAAEMAGLNVSDQNVIDNLFDLFSEKIRDLIIDYLIYQNRLVWTERCIIEAQIQENQRIRFKPIQNKTVIKPRKRKKKEDENVEDDEDPTEDDDKYIIEASNKKHELTSHYNTYNDLIQKYDTIIFQDHNSVKDAAVRRRRTLDSMAK